jgi:hypothetical protein
VFIDTHANPDTQRDHLAPDIPVYAHDNLSEDDAKADFFEVEFFFELKLADTSDPFRDPEYPLSQADDFRFEGDLEDAQLVCGQLASYAAAHMGSQFCAHTFTVLICGQSVRLICWERSSAAVTWRFNYINDPRTLAGFFWCYDRRQRGFDTSASPASLDNKQQIQHIENSLRDDNPARREFRNQSFRITMTQRLKNRL